MIWLGPRWRRKFGPCSAEISRALTVCLLTVLVAGCWGGDDVDRIAIQGEVLLDNAPLSQGTISILPAEGQSGPAATTTITGGRFEFDRQNGPSAGPHRVVINLVGGVDKPKLAAMKGRQGPGGAPSQATPPKRRRWEREVDVPKTGPFQYDVTLSSSQSANL